MDNELKVENKVFSSNFFLGANKNAISGICKVLEQISKCPWLKKSCHDYSQAKIQNEVANMDFQYVHYKN